MSRLTPHLLPGSPSRQISLKFAVAGPAVETARRLSRKVLARTMHYARLNLQNL